jgi:hypothetical protein
VDQRLFSAHAKVGLGPLDTQIAAHAVAIGLSL